MYTNSHYNKGQAENRIATYPNENKSAVNYMVKTEIRLKYSGLIVFTSRLLSVTTGLAFVLMITRSVSKEQFGIWGNLSDVLSYFILLSGILPFWTTHHVVIVVADDITIQARPVE